LHSYHPIIASHANVVLGSYDQNPECVEVAKALKAHVFSPPQRLWKFLTTSSETWTATQAFLDTSIRGRSLFCLATPPLATLPGGSYWAELQYLMRKEVTPDQFQLIRFPLRIERQSSSKFLSLFGWDNRRLARKQYQRLTQEIDQNLRFLFKDYQGEIVLNRSIPFPPAFDYAFVTIATHVLRLRIAQGRGELSVCVAPLHAPDDWQELSMVLMAMNTPEGIGQRPRYAFWHDVVQLLQTLMNVANEAMSEKRWIVITERLNRLYALPFKEQWETLSKI